MSYVKEGESIAVRTELNDKPQYEGSGSGLIHADWCEDMTCYCKGGRDG